MKMKTGRLNLSRGLPKTGVLTSVVDYDDGYYQAGWWKGTKYPNLRTRFIAKTLNGDDVVLDLATGLMWAADGDELGCNGGAVISWQAAIDFPSANPFAGYDDWRLPNIKELFSIVDNAHWTPAIKEPPFANTKTGHYWSSNTDINTPSRAFYLDFGLGSIFVAAKTETRYMRMVRGGV